jgi:hypothetical protein
MRQVIVEFLRRGPQHNQLLSPLTDYLAVCGDFPACVVHVPWEHNRLLHLLDELRYDVASSMPADRLAAARDEVGAELARMLASITGLPGSLTGAQLAGQVTHFRIVVSASELALLPFELSKVPVSTTEPGGEFLSVQPDRLVCLTRQVRSMRGAATAWSTEPNVLFVSGVDVPFERHLDALLRVVEPWRRDPMFADPSNPRLSRCDVLTALRDGTLDELATVASSGRFTHVHVLAHGAAVDDGRTQRHGIALGDRVVRGEELAMSLSAVGGRRGCLPSVVTLASCDSAAQGSVMTPGGSIAHALHSAGIGLVVASQFPLSEDASVPFAEVLYAGLLRGDHPFDLVCDVRRELATSFSDEHAWGSIAVYEALPADFDDHLERLRYWQSRRALEKALLAFEELATSDAERTAHLARSGRPFADDFRSADVDEYRRRLHAVGAAQARLPSDGAYGAEGNGLRASALKRIAEVAFWSAQAPDVDAERRSDLHEESVRSLQRSLALYTSTMDALLVTAGEQLHRKATFHWIIGQVLVLRAILNIDRDDDDDLRGAARLTARLELDNASPEVRGWALVSFVELALVELAVPAGNAVDTAGTQAVRHARDIVKLLGHGTEQVELTRRQMRRYITWWGSAQFEETLRAFGVEREISWVQRGVLALAEEIAEVLTPPGSAPAAHRVAAVADPPVMQADEPSTPAERSGMLQLEMLPSKGGDCLWLSYGENPAALHHVLVDCGSRSLTPIVADRIRAAPGLELLVLTHIDLDHVGGATELLADDDVLARTGDVWFNGWNQLRGFLGVRQGEQISDILDRDDRPCLWNRTARSSDPPPPIEVAADGFPEVTLADGLRLTVLSPTRAGLRRLARNWNAALREFRPEKAMLGRRSRPAPVVEPAALNLAQLAATGPTKDPSVPNLSSIALLAEYGGRAVLLAADAHADVLTASVRGLQRQRRQEGRPLRIDALKLSHHGSANATSKELLGVLDCQNYLVSTNGAGHYHPDRPAIARVICHGGPRAALHFNYRTEFTELWDDAGLRQRYGYAAHYPEDPDGAGLTVRL